MWQLCAFVPTHSDQTICPGLCKMQQDQPSCLNVWHCWDSVQQPLVINRCVLQLSADIVGMHQWCAQDFDDPQPGPPAPDPQPRTPSPGLHCLSHTQLSLFLFFLSGVGVRGWGSVAGGPRPGVQGWRSWAGASGGGTPGEFRAFVFLSRPSFVFFFFRISMIFRGIAVIFVRFNFEKGLEENTFGVLWTFCEAPAAPEGRRCFTTPSFHSALQRTTTNHAIWCSDQMFICLAATSLPNAFKPC